MEVNIRVNATGDRQSGAKDKTLQCFCNVYYSHNASPLTLGGLYNFDKLTTWKGTRRGIYPNGQTKKKRTWTGALSKNGVFQDSQA